MTYESMGSSIASRRRELGMTQKELADRLGITDKAVSKWERDVCCPDTALLSPLSEILGLSLEELVNAKAAPQSSHRGANYYVNLILKVIPLAMGITVTVTAILGELDTGAGFTMLGLGLASLGLYNLNRT